MQQVARRHRRRHLRHPVHGQDQASHQTAAADRRRDRRAGHPSAVEVDASRSTALARTHRPRAALIAGHPGLGSRRPPYRSPPPPRAATGRWRTQRSGARHHPVRRGRPRGHAGTALRRRRRRQRHGRDRRDGADGDAWKAVERSFSLREDIRLAIKVEHIGNVALLIVDPITAYLGDGVKVTRPPMSALCCARSPRWRRSTGSRCSA